MKKVQASGRELVKHKTFINSGISVYKMASFSKIQTFPVWDLLCIIPRNRPEASSGFVHRWVYWIFYVLFTVSYLMFVQNYCSINFWPKNKSFVLSPVMANDIILFTVMKILEKLIISAKQWNINFQKMYRIRYVNRPLFILSLKPEDQVMYNSNTIYFFRSIPPLIFLRSQKYNILITFYYLLIIYSQMFWKFGK